MKPSQCNRRACEIARDFLVGLALFFTVFMLAMLDSRASHSATAVEYIAAPPGIHANEASSINPAPDATRLARKKSRRGYDELRVAGAPSEMGRSWMIAVMALFFAAMTAITGSLWRHLRSSVAAKRGRKV